MYCSVLSIMTTMSAFVSIILCVIVGIL